MVLPSELNRLFHCLDCNNFEPGGLEGASDQVQVHANIIHGEDRSSHANSLRCGLHLLGILGWRLSPRAQTDPQELLSPADEFFRNDRFCDVTVEPRSHYLL